MSVKTAADYRAIKAAVKASDRAKAHAERPPYVQPRSWKVYARFRTEGAPLLPTLRGEDERDAELEQAGEALYQGGPVHSARFELCGGAPMGRGSDGFVYYCFALVGEAADGTELQATKSRGRYTWNLRALAARFPRGLPCVAVDEEQRAAEAERLPITSWALPSSCLSE